MAVVAYLVRADLRRRWKAWAALAVLLAAAGGVSLFAITGWQRTSTAMDRFLDEFHPGDAIVVGPDLDREAVLALPDVIAADGGEYFFLVPDGPDGRPELGALGAVNPFSSSSGNVLHGMSDARVIEGRKPDIDEELEIAVDEELAKAYGVRAGDTFSMTALSPEQLIADDGDLVGLTMPEGPHFDFEITAVLRRPSDVVPTSGGDADVVYLGTQDLYLTPAFHRAHFQRDVAGGCGALLEHNGRRAEPALVALDSLQGSIGPTMLSGRAPGGADEVSLGSVTARQLGAELGDTVLVGSGDCGEGLHQMELTGLVLFNRALFAEREGALVDLPALDALSVEAESGLVLLNRAPGVSLADAHAALRDDFGRTVLGPQAPDDLDALDRVRGLPLLVAAFLGVLALGTLMFTLGSVLRRSRRDVAVLKAMGLAPRQAASAILVHAASLIVVPAVAGVLLGIAAGRLSWSAITQGLGAPDLPVVPLIATGLAVPAAILAAIAVAAYPAHLAARTAPAIALRTE